MPVLVYFGKMVRIPSGPKLSRSIATVSEPPLAPAPPAVPLSIPSNNRPSSARISILPPELATFCSGVTAPNDLKRKPNAATPLTSNNDPGSATT